MLPSARWSPSASRVTSLALFGHARMTLASGTWGYLLWYQITLGMGTSFVFVPLTMPTMAPIPRLPKAE